MPFAHAPAGSEQRGSR